VYPKAKESFITQSPSIDMDTDTIKVRLLRSSAYTFSSAHQFASSLPSAIVTDVALASKAGTNGVFSAANAVFTAVPSGAAIDELVVYKDTGTAGTSPLVCYMDGFSITPNGGDITVQWNASGIFAL
jgi:hypothetical protein